MADYRDVPMLVYWEVTRACALACRHCRAKAVPFRDPRELTTAEGEALLEVLADSPEPQPHVVLTGGDPLQRPDLLHLVSYARQLGLRVSVTPSGTPSLTTKALTALRDSGVTSLAFSLDGATAEQHDLLRGVRGSFQATVAAILWSVTHEVPVQVNTLVAAETRNALEDVGRLVRYFRVSRWALFFLVRTGRGEQLHELKPEEAEETLEWLYRYARQMPKPVVKTTEAHHYRRIEVEHTLRATPRQGLESSQRGAWGVRDGAGIVFISHTGDVYPSGFLPVTVGNVRKQDVLRLYREAPLLRALRDPNMLKGKCRRCEYRAICGGSRARAFAATGDPLEADPLCPYQPRQTAAEAAAVFA